MDDRKIRSYLSNKLKRLEIKVLDEVDSTNAYAKKLARSGTRCALVIARTQTEGRGRLGRSFFSPPGSGLYMSLIVGGTGKLAQSARITVAAGVAVCRAIEKLTDLNPKIKWVNDIYLYGKKVCGILAEAVTAENDNQDVSIVVGIGVNVKKSVFPKEVADIATALDRDISLSQLTAEITNNFMAMNENLLDSKILADYKKRMFILGQEIEYIKDGDRYIGVAEDINEDGNLIVRKSGGEAETLIAGEVTQHKE